MGLLTFHVLKILLVYWPDDDPHGGSKHVA
jgi:hypothetical protein